MDIRRMFCLKMQVVWILIDLCLDMGPVYGNIDAYGYAYLKWPINLRIKGVKLTTCVLVLSAIRYTQTSKPHGAILTTDIYSQIVHSFSNARYINVQ